MSSPTVLRISGSSVPNPITHQNPKILIGLKHFTTVGPGVRKILAGHSPVAGPWDTQAHPPPPEGPVCHWRVLSDSVRLVTATQPSGPPRFSTNSSRSPRWSCFSSFARKFIHNCGSRHAPGSRDQRLPILAPEQLHLLARPWAPRHLPLPRAQVRLELFDRERPSSTPMSPSFLAQMTPTEMSLD